MLLSLLASLALASPGERLDRLIAALPLAVADDRAALATLAETDPATVWQVLDPARRAALAYVLALPPAEIRAIKQGQAVVRAAGEGSDAEWAALWALAEALGERPRRVTAVRVRTVDAALVRVDLELRRETHGIGLAFPDEAAPPRVAVDLYDALGVDVPAPAALQDGGFETAWSAGLAWEEAAPPGTSITRDGARAKAGARSLRLESRTRAVPVAAQVLAARPGERVVVAAEIGPDGTDGVLALVFALANGSEERVEARAAAGETGWTTVTVDGDVPEGAVARVELTLGGPGAASFDEVAVRRDDGDAAPLSDWKPVRGAALVAHVDPNRCVEGEPVGRVCGASAAAHLDAAVSAGLTRLSLSVERPIDVWLFAEEAHRAELARRLPGGPRGAGGDPERGRCFAVAGDPWAAACPLSVALTRAWGPPGNDVLGVGLPRALAGSGVDLHAAARPTLASLGALTAPSATPTRGRPNPAREAAVTSFAAWLSETQSLAALRAAWQAEDLGAYTIAGRSFAALEAEWRAFVGR